MDLEPEQDPAPAPHDEVELVSDGENLLVIGDDAAAVERFLDDKGMLARSRALAPHELGHVLRSSAQVAGTVAESIGESSRWVKLMPESVEAIKQYGLTDSGVPGVAYAMAGTRGSLKEWLRIDTTAGAKAANPAVLSGIAGVMTQAAREQEAAQLRALLQSLDQKLDQVLRGQRDEILGDLEGIEREIRAARRIREMEGSIDPLTWSKLSGASLQVRQVQAKAIRKLAGVGDELDEHRRVGDLNAHLPRAKSGVRLWLATIARCAAAVDELTVLELDHCAAIAPELVDTRRMSLETSRREDHDELHQGISVLLQRMDSAAAMANQNKILHVQGVPAAIGSIEDARGTVRRFYEALGIEVDWDSLDPVQWRAAIREWRQWRNGLQEGVSVAWEKGKPAILPLAATVLAAVVKDKFLKKPGS